MNLDRLTCVHEAAHAIVGLQFGFSIDRVVVHAAGSRGTEGGRCENASWRTDVNTDPTRVLCYLVAGSIAERRVAGRASARDASDRELARGLAMTFCEVDDEDHPRVRAMLAAAVAQATLLIHTPITWRSIERAARTLQQTGEICGRDALQILREEASR